MLEGSWPGDLIVIEFPDRTNSETWYASTAYQSILHLRRKPSEGDIVIVEGVTEDHRAIDVLP